MKKIIVFILLFTLCAFGQQINYSLGKKLTSGDAWTLAGINHLDTLAATTYSFVFDLNDFYWMDVLPLVDTTGVALLNSNLQYLGTFYGYFDCTNAADSLMYVLSAYPGVYGLDNKSDATIDWGSAITLETIRRADDYLSINNVYIHATKYKLFPPEVIKIVISQTADSDKDDSIHFDWKYAYPAIIQTVKERKPSDR